jgi:hypothetical protein
MSGNYAQKTPMVLGLNRWASDKINTAMQVLGKSLPASVVSVDGTGTIVTVKFEMESDFFTLPQVQCPVATTQYNRPPLQQGDPGIVIPCDYYIGGISGLGGGVANFEKQPNLSTLVFLPIGSTNFTTFTDTDPQDTNGTYFLTGPDGVILMTSDQTTSMALQKNGGVMVNAPLGHNIFGANLVTCLNEPDAKAKGIPQYGFWVDSSGVVHMVLTP